MAETKEIPNEYVLITYDLPATAKHIRYLFLKKAASIGAMQHTASCYLMPYSQDTLKIADELGEIAQVYIWTSQIIDKEQAKEVHNKYADMLKLRCTQLEQRFAITQDYIDSGTVGKIDTMRKRTTKLLADLVKISAHYEAAWFVTRVDKLRDRWEEVYGKPTDPKSNNGSGK